MIPNLDFIRTMLEGIRESVFAGIKRSAAELGHRISEVDAKIQPPDYAAGQGAPGYILNKPELVGRPGTGDSAEIFNNYGHNVAEGVYAHAEGTDTTASGSFGSHAEGCYTTASGSFGSHAEGHKAVASGMASHAEGHGTIAASDYQHVQGAYNVEDAEGRYSHIVGNGKSDRNDAGEIVERRSNAHTLDWDGNAWFAGEVYVGSTSGTDKDGGSKKLATEEFVENAVKNSGSSGGSGVGAAGTGTNAEVFNGGSAENASGAYAHAEGRGTTASGEDSHAEGARTTASGAAAHAEGEATQATNFWSHAEGFECVSGGLASHAEGMGTIAASDAQHAEGFYNIEDALNKYLHIVGNGASDTARSNAHTLDRSGNAWFAGSVEGTALILTSPGGKRFMITVDDDGTLQSAEVTA